MFTSYLLDAKRIRRCLAAGILAGTVGSTLAQTLLTTHPETGVQASTSLPPPDNALKFGTFERPYAANSLWNSKPVNPTLAGYMIPASDYYPAVTEGSYSTGAFLARPTDGPMTVKGRPGSTGVWDPDSEVAREITIPRWPAEAIPASASDGHMDIIDPMMGVVHSFWQLKKIDDHWTAALYAWSPLRGRGWPDPAHYYQGARAVGVPASAGIIRTHEIHDGAPIFLHALAMSMTFNGLSANPTFVYPATSADATAAKTNQGQIPEGALLMLPSTFDTRNIPSPELRKVAETLKVYGARVVDRNRGTPYVIYVEIGSGFDLRRGAWNPGDVAALQNIRSSLREVKSVSGWIDGNGAPFGPDPGPFNILSMRGPWRPLSGSGSGAYDTWKQAVVFAAGSDKTVLTNTSGRNINNAVTWSAPETGKRYRLTAVTTGGAKLRMAIREGASGPVMFDSGELAQGESKRFTWPNGKSIAVTAISGTSGESTVSGTLVAEP